MKTSPTILQMLLPEWSVTVPGNKLLYHPDEF